MCRVTRTTTFNALSEAEVEAVAEALGAMRSKVGKTALAKLDDPESFDVGKRFYDDSGRAVFPIDKPLPSQAFILGVMTEWNRRGHGYQADRLKSAVQFFVILWNDAHEAWEKAQKQGAPKGKRGKMFVGSDEIAAETEYERYRRNYPGSYKSGGVWYDKYGNRLS